LIWLPHEIEPRYADPWCQQQIDFFALIFLNSR